MGIVVLIIGLAVVGFGVMQHLKGKRLLAAPFQKTGQVATAGISPDPKGLISTEGTISAEPLLSPCSKTPCIWYQVEITRKFEKSELTQNGTKTTKGSHKVDTMKKGTTFVIDDGSGPIPVDGTHGGDFDNLKKTFGKEIDVRNFFGDLQFGELRIPPPGGGEGRTIAYEAVEKVVTAEGLMFVLGKLENGTIGKPGWRSMIFSSKGRDGLLKATNRNRTIGFGAGGLAMVAAIPLMIFGVGSSKDGCPKELAGTVELCKGRINSKSGNNFKWTVTEAGEYSVAVQPPQGLKFPIYPKLTITDAQGAVVAERSGSGDAPTVAKAHFEVGEYKLNVRESSGIEVSGGFDFSMKIASLSLPLPLPEPEPAMVVAEPEEQVAPPAVIAEPAPVKPVRGTTTRASTKKAGATKRTTGPTP